MEKANTLGKMEDIMKESTNRIRKMGLVYIIGQMIEYIKDIEEMVNNMVRESTHYKTAMSVKEYGIMEEE